MASTSRSKGSSEQRTALRALEAKGKAWDKTWGGIRKRLGLTDAMNTATVQATFEVLDRLGRCKVSTADDDIVVESLKWVAQENRAA